MEGFLYYEFVFLKSWSTKWREEEKIGAQWNVYGKAYLETQGSADMKDVIQY